MGSQSQKIRGLVMPGDNVITPGKLKKQLMFFDQVILSDPSDRALIDHRELHQTSRDGRATIWQTAKSPFPRHPDYEAVFRELLAGTDQLQRRGVLRVLSQRDWRAIDPWLRMSLHFTALADAELVRSAIPEFSENEKIELPPLIRYEPFLLQFEGQPPEQLSQMTSEPEYKIPDVDENWHHLAYLRLGRTVKYIRVAQINSAAPVAWDDSTSGTLMALGRSAFRDLPSVETLAGAAIALDVCDPQELEAALEETPWSDVIKIRKEILPHVAQYRSKVLQMARRVHKVQVLDFGEYRKIVQTDRQSLDHAQEKLREAWQGLKLVASLKGLGPVCATTLIIPSDWTSLLGRVLTGLAVGAGVLAGDIKTFLQTREQVQRHPLFVIDRLLSKGR